MGRAFEVEQERGAIERRVALCVRENHARYGCVSSTRPSLRYDPLELAGEPLKWNWRSGLAAYCGQGR